MKDYVYMIIILIAAFILAVILTPFVKTLDHLIIFSVLGGAILGVMTIILIEIGVW